MGWKLLMESYMLKECYYFDQDQYDNVDYIYLHRFIDRMIQYRNSTKGSYDGQKRIEEIKRLDLDKVSYNTKLILLHCIYKHNAVELLKLPSLKGLAHLDYKDISFLEEQKQFMKLKVEDFYNNIKKLNDAIKTLIEQKKLDADYIFEIKCIGGFAMSYWKLRESGLTEDMDSLIEINSMVKEAIRNIAKSEELPYDWINDTMINFYSNPDSFHWVEIPWFFGKDSKIKVYVCSKEDLLKNKIHFAEKYLEGIDNQDRDAEVDYKDTLSILNSFGISTGTNPAMIRIKLEEMGIYKKDYPRIYAQLIEDGEDEGEDYYILKGMRDVDKGKNDLDSFKDSISRFGYSLDDVINTYSMYVSEFPTFMQINGGLTPLMH